MKIIFIATSSFALPVLKAIQPCLVITAPDQKKNISPVKLYAQKKSYPVFQPKNINSPASLSKVKTIAPDLIITASYGQILGKKILSIPKYGCLNLHASLLPKYRGASPVQTAILNNEKFTGVTLILMDEKMDHGKIITQKKIKIKKNENAQILHNRLAKLSAKILTNTLPLCLQSSIKPKKQNHQKASYTKKIKKKDGKIDFKKYTALQIQQMFLAYNPWPGIYFTFFKKNRSLIQIKIIELKIISQTKKSSKTGLFIKNKNLFSQCKQGILAIEKLQPESKKIITGEEFMSGYLQDFTGDRQKTLPKQILNKNQ